MVNSFRGGVHPEAHKELTSGKAIEIPPPPDAVQIPMVMHVGVPCEPIVKPGETVKMGQKIGDTTAFVAVPVHSSVSGTVRSLSMALHPNGARVPTVIIDNDGQDTPAFLPRTEGWEIMGAEEMTNLIREAGIVGLGGAAFPTHVKIRSAIGRVDTLIINGCESEPYSSSDNRIMIENADEIVGGARILLRIFPRVRAVIAVEDNKPEAEEALRRAIGADNRIKALTFKTKYPQGSEKQLIKSVTGREVPPGKLPADAKCAVFNVDTAAAIHRAFLFGTPVIRRIVTVAGSAIANPKNLEVRVGTPLKNLVAACGGYLEKPVQMIMGGPMMGAALVSDEVPVIKSTNAFLAFSSRNAAEYDAGACIRCGRCVAVCPMRLMPTYLYLHAENDRWDKCDELNVTDCMECGACAYECPARLHLVQMLRVAKAKAQELRRH